MSVRRESAQTGPSIVCSENGEVSFFLLTTAEPSQTRIIIDDPEQQPLSVKGTCTLIIL